MYAFSIQHSPPLAHLSQGQRILRRKGQKYLEALRWPKQLLHEFPRLLVEISSNRSRCISTALVACDAYSRHTVQRRVRLSPEAVEHCRRVLSLIWSTSQEPPNPILPA